MRKEPINDVILQLAGKISIKKIAELAGCSKGCIEYRAKKLGFSLDSITMRKKEKKEVLVKEYVRKEVELFKVRNGVIIDINLRCPITGVRTETKPRV